MRDAFVRYQEHFWQHFDPRVRGLARRLWDAGFSPLAMEDDEDDELDEPCVFLRCSPENMVAESDRLHELVLSWRLPEHQVACSECGGDTCGVEAVYDPAERDTTLILWGIEDKMLKRAVGVKRAVGRPPVNSTRSGGAGITR